MSAAGADAPATRRSVRSLRVKLRRGRAGEEWGGGDGDAAALTGNAHAVSTLAEPLAPAQAAPQRGSAEDDDDRARASSSSPAAAVTTPPASVSIFAAPPADADALPAAAQPARCSVADCGAALPSAAEDAASSAMAANARRVGLCEAHLRADVVLLAGKRMRFCRRCARVRLRALCCVA
jgi:hypothetical protein